MLMCMATSTLGRFQSPTIQAYFLTHFHGTTPARARMAPHHPSSLLPKAHSSMPHPPPPSHVSFMAKANDDNLGRKAHLTLSEETLIFENLSIWKP
jgi:hypothetical protein